MKNSNTNKYQKKILTIPNLLSFFRLCLIPVMVWLYGNKHNYSGTFVILLVSGATDIVDGIIARRLHMVSDFGKVFDPIADKLTQMAMLLCLVTRFQYMSIPLVILIVKEVTAAVMNLIAIKKTSVVMGAVWHGKLTTVLLYGTVAVHLIWFNIPIIVSNILIAVSSVMMLFSAVKYTVRNIKILAEKSDCIKR